MSIRSTRSRATRLYRQWQEMKKSGPRLFPSEIAQRLKVSEAELLASGPGDEVTLLGHDWNRILDALPLLGPVKTITRNPHAVIEKDGTYPQFQHFSGHAMFVSDSIDLRITPGQWKFAFAVQKPSDDGPASHSLQFFDRYGEAVHKVFLLPVSFRDAFRHMVQDFHVTGQSEIAVENLPPAPAEREPDAEESTKLLAAWAELQDTHDFFTLLGKFHLTRLSAFRAAEGRFTRKVSNDAATALLEHSACAPLPLMIFAGNRGCIQIHKGVLGTTASRGEWFSAMNKGSEFHLRPDGIQSSWVVEKPTRDGPVISLEIFDRSGQDIAMFFGIRKEGEVQSRQWLDVIANLK